MLTLRRFSPPIVWLGFVAVLTGCSSNYIAYPAGITSEQPITCIGPGCSLKSTAAIPAMGLAYLAPYPMIGITSEQPIDCLGPGCSVRPTGAGPAEGLAYLPSYYITTITAEQPVTCLGPGCSPKPPGAVPAIP